MGQRPATEQGREIQHTIDLERIALDIAQQLSHLEAKDRAHIRRRVQWLLGCEDGEGNEPKSRGVTTQQEILQDIAREMSPGALHVADALYGAQQAPPRKTAYTAEEVRAAIDRALVPLNGEYHVDHAKMVRRTKEAIRRELGL